MFIRIKLKLSFDQVDGNIPTCAEIKKMDSNAFLLDQVVLRTALYSYVIHPSYWSTVISIGDDNEITYRVDGWSLEKVIDRASERVFIDPSVVPDVNEIKDIESFTLNIIEDNHFVCDRFAKVESIELNAYSTSNVDLACVCSNENREDCVVWCI